MRYMKVIIFGSATRSDCWYSSSEARESRTKRDRSV